MICRVRLENLVIGGGFQQIEVPSMPDKVFEIPDEPVPFDTVFEGKQLLTGQPLRTITIKWGFKGAVGALQKHLTDDPTLDNAIQLTFINSSASSSFDMFEAFSGDEELPMTGRSAIIVER